MKTLVSIAFYCGAIFLTCGQGRVAWNEAINGPISNNDALPTALGPWLPGTNTVIGATEVEPTGSSWFVRGDYFTFSVPPSLLINALYLTIDNQKTWSWVGTADFGSTIGFVQNSVSGDLLAQWNSPSLPSGAYAMYMENSDVQPFTTVANYRLDFVVTPVPEPAAWALLALGGAGLWAMRRRRGQ